MGDQRYLARSLNTLGTLEILVEPAAALDKVVRAVELADRVGDLWCATDAGQIAAYGHLAVGHVADGTAWLDRTGDGARRLDNAQLLGWDLAGRGLAALLRGDLTSGEELLDAGLRQAGRTGDPNIVGSLGAWRSMCRAYRGDQAASAEVDAALVAARRSGAGQAERELEVALCVIRTIVGDLDGAEAAFAAAIELLEAFVPAQRGEAPGLRSRRRAAAGPGRRRPGPGRPGPAPGHRGHGRRPSCARARGRHGGPGGSGPFGLAARDGPVLGGAPVHQILEVLDDLGLAQRLEALDVLGVVVGRRGHPLDAVRIWAARDADADRCGLIMSPTNRWALGHRVAIADLLDAGEEATGRAEGSILAIAEVVAYVRRTRGGRKRPAFGWESLTPTESQVVELAASGLSNRLIGEQLFISAGTVKVHLGHVYAKLGLGNRTELAAALAQRADPVTSDPG